ncbi:MAG TPA: hypothetical protein PLA94_26095 [Myxococcota bacterium]|nr:hypothetical protein [Myxococcota bacterium]
MGSGPVALIGRVVVLSAVGGGVFVGLGLLLGIGELREVLGRLLRRLPGIGRRFS